MTVYDKDFEKFRLNNISMLISEEEAFRNKSRDWMLSSGKFNYTYNFSWFGLPIIQFPQDIVALQEVIAANKPDLIIETGVARGGSVNFSASMLALLDLRDCLANSKSYQISRKVVGIDVDIRSHTRDAIKNEPLNCYIELVEGSSISPEVIQKIDKISENYTNTLVLLDSNHTHDHVLTELNLYSSYVKSGGYIVVYDTSIEFDSQEFWNEKNRNWGPGNSPLSAINQFLKENNEFEVDLGISSKLGITVCPFGFLRRK